ncbi:hypothetical protein [Microvirga terricola]|uniref:Uncharacterized protein n=1 Tax=Microvirga terricola TaxID=2719797 RepID=A0ABX0V9F2_9HYPH|nr:hypothetical protein [Microvirga terricola]NIX75315.1 hypothetical protein [Microvirga terricola]
MFESVRCAEPAHGGFFCRYESSRPVFENIGDWMLSAITIISFALQLWQMMSPRPRQRSRVFFRKLKIGFIEMTSYEREDDIRS